ncbi:NECAP endocytosis associated isoform [Micractinium conductrix]|uniref:NECAP endocytosis associated isoform n=1 Tax=Micractinium conductrix TaxID=554055 RepID=A0A2P6V1M6_9CHLO|nr:NECAP endocytosis associated isoform [Micractinium conductrix]|eukprot:PSC67983.1 NECAP endocytosis associated isoform [Micractinium conductrix]
MEQVLFVQKELDVFRIPPRTGAVGFRSGEWRVADRIFTGRCRVVAQGDALEVRLEDPQTGELFGVAPVPPGQAHIAVEQAADSSRNFVLRLEDAASKRHAFVGVSFAERSAAFDFNCAVSDHERQRQRSAEMSKIAHAADPLAAAQASELLPEAAALYRQPGDLSLKEGETIKIAVKKAATPADGDSFLSRLGQPAAGGSSSAAGGGGAKLAHLAPPPGQQAGGFGRLVPPPPSDAAAPAAAGVRQQPATAAPLVQQQQQQQQQSAADDLLGLDFGAPAVAAPAAQSTAAAAEPDGWATFE